MKYYCSRHETHKSFNDMRSYYKNIRVAAIERERERERDRDTHTHTYTERKVYFSLSINTFTVFSTVDNVVIIINLLFFYGISCAPSSSSSTRLADRAAATAAEHYCTTGRRINVLVYIRTYDPRRSCVKKRQYY